MVGFVKRELLAKSWIRAQSCSTYRSKLRTVPHGSDGGIRCMAGGDGGRYVRIWVTGRMRFRSATNAGRESTKASYAQAREFYGPTRGQYDAPVRIAQKGGLYARMFRRGPLRKPLSGTLFGYAASQEQN